MSVVHSIGIAELKIVAQPERVRTVLGSCVGVAMFDRVAKIGGLAHVMLPSSEDCQGHRGKFADSAIDWLVDGLLQAGCDKRRLAAKITGGAIMFGTNVEDGLGDRNIKAVKAHLAQIAIRLMAEDVGGHKGRKMTFDPATGAVHVQFIGQQAKTI